MEFVSQIFPRDGLRTNRPYLSAPKNLGNIFCEHPVNDWELQKDAEKRKRYTPVLEFFNSLPDRQGWSLIQFNFTVGVRCSISTEDRTDPLSFVSTLKALGISSQANLEKIRKRVAKRTFEAHDLMLRSYYAVKFSSSTSVDLSRLLGNSFALQHCLRLPI